MSSPNDELVIEVMKCALSSLIMRAICFLTLEDKKGGWGWIDVIVIALHMFLGDLHLVQMKIAE